MTGRSIPGTRAVLAFAAIIVLASATGIWAQDEIPPEALFEKARLDSLFEAVAEQYPCDIREQVNDMIPRMHSVDFATDLGEVDGEIRVPIPPEIVRVWQLFGEIDFHGSGLGAAGTSIHFETPRGKAEVHYWRREDVFLSGHANMPLDDADYEEHFVVYKGKGRIDRISLRSPHGIPRKFDDSPWSTLGKDRPVVPVRIALDATRYRALNGSVDLERDKLWRLAYAYSLHPDTLVGARYCVERGFYPGRMIKKLDGLQRWGFQGRKLREDAERPGKPDYGIFEGVEFEADSRKQLDELFGEDFEYADCFDNWPPFMALKNTRVPNTRGTPADFGDAAELSSRYITAQKKAIGKTARWWEVKNESTVSSEWVLHSEPGVDSWGELARFHNVMADTIHRDNPEVLVGGPTSAWMALHHGGFDLGRRQLKFMDDTRDHLDFYSHHFYEGRDLVLADGDAHSSGYLMGRLEGCLDLLRNHMVLTDNVKPFVISETGTLTGYDTELDTWMNLKNLSSYLVRYMNHADKIDILNLWLLPVVHWNKQQVTLFVYGEDGKLELNPTVAHFLELWRDYRGSRIPAKCRTAGTAVHLHAVREGRTIQLALNNLNPCRVMAEVALSTGGAKVVAVEQTRLYFDKGKIIFETVERDSLREIPLAVEETSILKVTLDRAPEAGETVDERTFYGDKVLQGTGAPVEIGIECATEGLCEARLRVCVSRDGGFSEAMAVRVNGTELPGGPIDLTPEKKQGNYWGFATLDVPVALVRERNVVTLDLPQEGGWVTSVVMVNGYSRPVE